MEKVYEQVGIIGVQKAFVGYISVPSGVYSQANPDTPTPIMFKTLPPGTPLYALVPLDK